MAGATLVTRYAIAHTRSIADDSSATFSRENLEVME
jgi:hypothetical protein